MANTNSEDLLNRNLDKPIIRTMENDLRSLKSDLSPKEIFKNLPKVPGNLPIDFVKPAPAKQENVPASREPFPGPKFSAPEPEIELPVENPEAVAPGKFQPQSEIHRPPVSRPVAPVSRDERQMPEIPKKDYVTSPAGSLPEIKTEKPRPSYIPSFIPPAPVEKKPSIPFSPPNRTEIPPVASSARPIFKSPSPEPTLKTAEAPVSRPRQYAIPREEENLPPEARLATQSFVPDPASEKAAGNGNSSVNPLPNPLSAPSQSYKFYDKEESGGGNALGKILKYVIMIILLAGVLYGIYYFGVLKRPDALLPEASGELLVSGASPVEIKTNLNAEALEAIRKYFQNEAARNSSGVYRIILKDESGNRVLAKDNFKTALKMDFPAGVANALGSGYNLVAFFYPKRNYLRLGMVLEIKDSVSLSRQLNAWEPAMPKNLEGLFLGSAAPVAPAQNFRSNTYNGASIKYSPLGSGDAALNYAMDKNKKFLLIATSRDDMFYLINSAISK